jgi:hypothetical protein
MKKLFITLLFLVLSLYIKAQEVGDSGSLIQGGLEDGEKLLNAYITPINKAIVFGLSDITYTKIKEEDSKLNLGIKLAFINIPETDLTYDVSQLGLLNIEAKDPTKVIAPTVFGDSLNTIRFASKKHDLFGRPLFEFDAPTGSQKNTMPLPFLGATYKMNHTNISLNFIPYVTIPTSDLKVGMLGLSIQQDIAAFIKTLQDKPFGVSLQASATYLYGHSNLDVSPNGVYIPVTLYGSTTGPYDNQELNLIYSSINFGIYADYVIAKKYTFFAGAGYNLGSSRILLSGKYPVFKEDPSGGFAVVGADVVDPLDLKDQFSRSKIEIGARADWKRFYLQLNYNIATYGGLGLNLGYKM